MARMRLARLAVDHTAEGFCIVKSAQVRSNVKGVAYLDLVLSDAEGEIAAKLWDYDPAHHGTYGVDDVIKVRGTLTIWKDAEQLKVERIRQATAQDGVDMSALLPCAPFDPQWMYDVIYDTAENFQDGDLRLLVQHMLKTNRERLLLFPAAVKLHHATRGGLLHHTMTMLQLARHVVEVYPALCPDLLYTGVILHDIAKLDELEASTLGLAAGYTKAGQLLGHISMGVAAVAGAAELLGIDAETAMLVQHMLLAHHGQPEYGSPRPPMFPEAEVLSEIDLMDSRLYQMFDTLDTVEVGGFSERIWALDNRQLYKHGK